MANTLGVYKPIFYAQEALTLLEKSLGMAGRVHRGFERERTSFGKGDTISIRRPANFTVATAPATAEDITTETVSITLDQWKEVKFKLTDQELAYTGERIINDHIRPAAHAIANNIDVALNSLATSGTTNGQSLGGVGPKIDYAGASLAVADIVDARKTLFNSGVMMDSDMHLQVDGAGEADLLKLPAFTEHQGAGLEGVSAQQTGHLTRKYGVEIFANQNAALQGAFTFGTASAGDNSLTVDGAHTPGTTSVDFLGGTGVETVLVGESVTILGKEYTVAVGGTVSTGAITLVLAEGLCENVPSTTVATVNAASNTADGGLMFHKNAFALAMAPLPMVGKELGANVATVADPITGLAVRSRMYYVGNSSEVHVALDVLYGVRILNSMYACRLMK